MKKLAVVALGGNALLRNNQSGTIEEQEKNTTETLENLIYLIEDGYNLVLTHGNGPQVGNILLRNDAGDSVYHVPQMPLDICVADSQGGIGYMIERLLRNVLADHHMKKDVVTIVTQVLVDKDDEAFANPRKRIGKTYSKEDAEKLINEKNWVFKESPKQEGAWRRVVPSPKPLQVFNAQSIKALADQGTIVIATGGGGVPVWQDENGHVSPLDAVIDKDNASSLLATNIGADEFYILTDVPYVFLDFNTKDQREIEFLNREDTYAYLADGKFGEGNMAPKIRASLRFIESGGSKSVITEATKLEDRSYGTKITMDYED